MPSRRMPSRRKDQEQPVDEQLVDEQSVDAITMLKEDHQRVKDLFAQYGYPLKAGHRYTTMVSGLESRGRQ
jgi:hypothetical protein